MRRQQSLKQNSRLPDGTVIRALPKKYTQMQVFKLRESGLYVPQTEGIATVRQLDDALNKSGAYQDVLGNAECCRSGEVGFYPRGFEKDLTRAIGKRIVWMEAEGDANWHKTGRLLVAILDLSRIADEKVTLVDGSEITLQKAPGMGVIPIEKLELKTTEDNDQLVIYEVSISSDFNSATDLKVKNVARPRSWSTSVDKDGFALNDGRVADLVGRNTESARGSTVLHSKDFHIVFHIVSHPKQLPAEQLVQLFPELQEIIERGDASCWVEDRYASTLERTIQETVRTMDIKPEEIGCFVSIARGFEDKNGTTIKRAIIAAHSWSWLSDVAIVNRPEVQGTLEARS